MKRKKLFGLIPAIVAGLFIASSANAERPIFDKWFSPASASADTHSMSEMKYGEWKKVPSVKDMVETGKLLPNHTYYYTGSVNGPECFIAVDNRFKLRDSRVWAKADEMSPKMMEGWLQVMKQGHGDRSLTVKGGEIITPSGKVAGIWYSHYVVNIIEMSKDGELVVYQPHPIGGKPLGQD